MLAGTILHFVYDWSGHNVFVAFFSPVSESVWEHLKLFFVPAFSLPHFMITRVERRDRIIYGARQKVFWQEWGLLLLCILRIWVL